MKKIIFLIINICLLVGCGTKESTYVQISGQIIDNDKIKEVKLYKTVNGREVEIAKTTISSDGFYGFMFQPEEEGVFTLGKLPHDLYRIYIKNGDKLKINLHEDHMELVESNSREMQIFYEWYQLSYEADLTGLRFTKKTSTYEDFFPAFEKLLTKAEEFKANIQTKNEIFNDFMKRMIEYDKDHMALGLLYTPRNKHAQREERPAYYTTLLNKEKLKDTEILKLPYGLQLMEQYTMFYFSTINKTYNYDESIEAITDNAQLRGEMVLFRANRYKLYEDYLNMMEKYKKYFVTDDQKRRAEAIGSKLYDPNEGKIAADFTYPDVNGKMVSLSDFKGKVVLVDVWASWCSPCRQEIPYLKKLEQEMHDKDVVFIGVSMDVEKDKEKWKNMLRKEELNGVQLFANGFQSKIAGDYKITGIPRFMVFDRVGDIVALNAPRPSNPALKTLLEKTLKKN